VRERCKSRAAGSQQPDFIAIPHGTDRIYDGAALFIFLAQDGEEHADAEVKAFEEVEADPQYGDQDKPKDLEKFVRHFMPLFLVLRTDR
jgi:hypothetical protein